MALLRVNNLREPVTCRKGRQVNSLHTASLRPTETIPQVGIRRRQTMVESGIPTMEAQQVDSLNGLCQAAVLATQEMKTVGIGVQATNLGRVAQVRLCPMAQERSLPSPCFQKKKACSCFNIGITKSNPCVEVAALCAGTVILCGFWTVCTKNTLSDEYLFSLRNA